MHPEQLTKSLKSESRRLGFDLMAATPAVKPIGADYLADWVSAGYSGEMHYISERQDAYAHPKHVMDGVQSLLVLGLNYQTVEAAKTDGTQGRIARYAWGNGDYHDLIHKKLKSLCKYAKSLGDEVAVRGVVDTAPLLEREFAQLAGIGWRAKNTMVINREIGSWFFLAVLLVNQPLEYDQPFESDHCGTCTACLTACPTDAFPEPRVLDATKCISYLTIEHRSAIPLELRPKMDNWILGCDICQDVCPWNNKADTTDEVYFMPLNDQNPLDLIALFDLDDEQFRARFRKTPLWRPKRRGILRNAAIVLGNGRNEATIPALAKGLNDDEPLIRGACAWALGEFVNDSSGGRGLHRDLSNLGGGGSRRDIPHTHHDAKQILATRLVVEKDTQVRTEIELALSVIRE